MNKLLVLIALTMAVVSCKPQEARRPVSRKTGSYIDASIARNKKLNAKEEKQILEIIESNPERNYLTSDTGFWYYYNVKDSTASPLPQVGDLVSFNYDIKTLSGQSIISQSDMGTQLYQVDQSNQELMTGIREGIKLMKAGETITFLFPSHKAYGYYGYQDKIGSNLPIQSTVTLNEIKTKTTDD